MSPAHPLILTFALLFSLQSPPSIARRGADCRDSQECRRLALEADGRKDYEAFHDLAWRVVQTGPPNDPGAMFLLARAQSLSGRPGDALVMLRRLSAMGAQNDAATSDDFAAVRTLAGWPEAGARVAAVAPAEPPAPPASRREAPPALPAVDVAPSTATEALRFTTPLFTPAGLAYDAVSRRFIVGEREGRKLAVIDEFSHHVATLASGFAGITALEIDSREGTLWVASGEVGRTTVHKLQLVSGRALGSYAVPASFGPAQLVDVAASPAGGVLALDRTGRRLFKLRPKGQTLELGAALPESPASIAPASDGSVYIAHAGGIARADTTSRAVTPLRAATSVDLGGIMRLRWHRGSLIAVQAADAGTYRAMRLTLDAARRTVTAVTVLEGSLRTTDPTAITIVSDVLYFLASGEGAETVVRKIVLR